MICTWLACLFEELWNFEAFASHTCWKHHLINISLSDTVSVNIVDCNSKWMVSTQLANFHDFQRIEINSRETCKGQYVNIHLQWVWSSCTRSHKHIQDHLVQCDLRISVTSDSVKLMHHTEFTVKPCSLYLVGLHIFMLHVLSSLYHFYGHRWTCCIAQACLIFSKGSECLGSIWEIHCGRPTALTQVNLRILKYITSQKLIWTGSALNVFIIVGVVLSYQFKFACAVESF